MATKRSLPKPQRRRTPQFGGITLDDLYRLASLAVPFAGQPLSGGSNDWLISPASTQGGGQNWGFSGPQGSMDQTYNLPAAGGFTAAPVGGIDRGAYTAPVSAAPAVSRATAPVGAQPGKESLYPAPAPRLTATPLPAPYTVSGRASGAAPTTLTGMPKPSTVNVGGTQVPTTLANLLGAASAKQVQYATSYTPSRLPTLTRPVAY